MKRLVVQLLLFLAFLAVPAVASAALTPDADPTIIEGLRDKGVDWLKDKAKEAGQSWIFDTDQSGTMHDILIAARERADGYGNDKNGLCQGAVMGRASSILNNINYKKAAQDAAKLAFDTTVKMATLASGFGAAAAEGDAINWVVGQYADAAKDKGKDAVFDRIKKLFVDEKKPEFELFEKTGKNGDCDYTVRAVWDIVHGTYRVYIAGDCHCSVVGNVGVMPRQLGEWWISFEGHLTLSVDKEKGTTSWIVGPPVMDFDAQCACSKKPLRKAFAPVVKEQTVTGGAGKTPSGPPPLPPAGRKVCKECQKIQDEIDADTKALEETLDNVTLLQTRYEQAKAKLGQHEGSLDDPAAYGTTKEALQKDIEADRQNMKAIQAESRRLEAEQVRLTKALRDLGKLLEDCLKTQCPEGKSSTSPPPTETPPAIVPENKKKGVSYESSPFASRVLYIHNEARAAVGARPLQWDPQLAVTATAYATEMARTGQLVHAPREGRGIERENLNEAFHGSSPDQLMANWMNEKRNFSAGYFPNVARDGNWMNVAHYTQVIWPTTMFVGCGSARGAQWDFFVCRYSPGGNKDGQPVGYRDPSMFLGGPLDFNPSYSPILKAYRPSNPDRLEFGDEAVAAWKSFEFARGRCDLRGMNMSIDALKFDSRGAREHAVEEKSKGNDLASQSYAAMAKQIDQRVEDATLYRDACARNPYQYQERG